MRRQEPNRAGVSVLWVLALAAPVAMMGCPPRGAEGGGAAGADRGASPSAGLPALAIHPLTHIEGADASSGEGPTLVLHLSIAEPGGADDRGPGVLRVELVATDGASSSAGATGVLRSWTVDLSADAARARYDALVTRTWTLRLGGVPAEVAAWARSSGSDGSQEGAWVRVWWEGEDRSVTARLRR